VTCPSTEAVKGSLLLGHQGVGSLPIYSLMQLFKTQPSHPSLIRDQ